VNHEGDLELNKNCAGGRQEANSQTGTQQNHRESMNQTVGNRNQRDEKRTSGVFKTRELTDCVDWRTCAEGVGLTVGLTTS
jgi:hypothetical protein